MIPWTRNRELTLAVVKTFGVALLFACAFGGCASTVEVSPVGVKASEEFSLEKIFNPGAAVGCRQMFDTYCNSLHSPKAQGNISVGSGAHASQVYQGRTANDFSAAFYFYAKAKLRSRDQLPSDFRAALESQDYFTKLDRILSRPAKAQMTVASRVEYLRLESEAEVIWTTAIRETVLKRMEIKYRGFHRLREDAIPLEQAVTRVRVRNEFISDVARIIWSSDPNWKTVESSFEILRRHFLLVISELEIPEPVRVSWTERMKSVKLAIPGTIPESAESDCTSTQANAYYYAHLNVMTVCAGDFNTEGILQTVAHELGHALDLDRSLYLAARNSVLGQGMLNLRNQVCTQNRLSCADWTNFKTSLDPRLAEIGAFKPELFELQKCLQRRPALKVATDVDYQRIAESTVSDQVSDLASSGVFLRITKEKVPTQNGTLEKNPNYMNPCGYRLWSQGEEALDDESTELLFFTAEYQCSAAAPKDRLLQAIEVSKSMTVRITKTLMSAEKEFSPRDALGTEGFAASPSERFADLLGSYTFASYLSEVRDTWLRRYLFLASSSWQCERPSLDSLYPEESTAERSFVFDAHSATAQRKTESFSEPMRVALDCEKDFKENGCELKFRNSLIEPLN
jgi:hypothetical protein